MISAFLCSSPALTARQERRSSGQRQYFPPAFPPNSFWFLNPLNKNINFDFCFHFSKDLRDLRHFEAHKKPICISVHEMIRSPLGCDVPR